MPNVLLFVDMLGVRARWHKGGRPDAEMAFKDFRNLIAGSLKKRLPADVSHGVIETDVVALTCSDVRIALDVGRNLYQMAFGQTRTNESRHYWLRGVIVPRLSDAPLRSSVHFHKPLEQVEIAHYEPELFDAVAIEKSGIKGMRLLVDKTLLTSTVVREYRVKIGPLFFTPFKRLRDSYYPKNIADTHIDYLWMVGDDHKTRSEIELLMGSRLRIAASDPEEFLQAAATQVVFRQAAAMICSLEMRVRSQRRRQIRRARVSETISPS